MNYQYMPAYPFVQKDFTFDLKVTYLILNILIRWTSRVNIYGICLNYCSHTTKHCT